MTYKDGSMVDDKFFDASWLGFFLKHSGPIYVTTKVQKSGKHLRKKVWCFRCRGELYVMEHLYDYNMVYNQSVVHEI